VFGHDLSGCLNRSLSFKRRPWSPPLTAQKRVRYVRVRRVGNYGVAPFDIMLLSNLLDSFGPRDGDEISQLWRDPLKPEVTRFDSESRADEFASIVLLERFGMVKEEPLAESASHIVGRQTKLTRPEFRNGQRHQDFVPRVVSADRNEAVDGLD
jgi:hypothetical protein